MLRIQVCSVQPSVHQWAPQVKKNGLALPAIQVHAYGEYLSWGKGTALTFLLVNKGLDTKTSFDNVEQYRRYISWPCMHHSKKHFQEIMIVQKNHPTLVNRNFSISCWHPRLSGCLGSQHDLPTDGTHMPCEAVLKVKIKHVKRKLDISWIEHKSALLERREFNNPTLNFYVVVCSSPKHSTNAVGTLH